MARSSGQPRVTTTCFATRFESWKFIPSVYTVRDENTVDTVSRTTQYCNDSGSSTAIQKRIDDYKDGIDEVPFSSQRT